MVKSHNLVLVTHESGAQTRCPLGTPVREILESDRDPAGLPYLGAVVNHDVTSLSYPLDMDSRVRPVTLADSHGWRIYRSSVSFLLAKAVHEEQPDARLCIEHSLGSGLYCTLEHHREKEVAEETLQSLEAAMHALAGKRLPIVRRNLPFEEALAYWEAQHMEDKLNLLRFHNPPKIPVHVCGDYMDVAHGPLTDHSGMLTTFALIPHPPGFVLQFPEREDPGRVAPFEPQPHLFNIFREYKQWGRVLGVRTVGDLNAVIARDEIDEFVRIAEALHEKKTASIADTIAARRGEIKCILIAGPSSAGKTTFAKRLSVQLRVNGIQPRVLSCDDYFIDREQSPRGADGAPDFEHLETIDLPLLHAHLECLDRGEPVAMPRYNFHTGRRRAETRPLRIAEDEVVIIEGIHALNPRLTEPLPAGHKFGIYISALTQLSIDHQNRIPTTDIRLLRRMVRDHQFRGNNALDTLRLWPNVRRGEKRWIFPFQAEAHVAFNSALDYETAILRLFAEPLLAQVKPSHAEYADARRLQAFLARFLTAAPGLVPGTSLLREYIGGSVFHY